MFDFFNDGFKRWNRYNTTQRELDLLTDRELADLGIMRSDIPRIARDSHDPLSVPHREIFEEPAG